MGFLKFLKREKKESLDELDLPPAPPPLEGFEDMELPEFPEFPEEKISAPEKLEEPKFELPEEEMLGKEELPELRFPEAEEESSQVQPVSASVPSTMPSITAPQISEPMPMPEPKPEERSFTREAYPKITGRLFTHEKRVLHERPTAKTIYVKVDKFKATLGSINMVRGDLRKSEEALVKLENIKNSKDKAFDKMKSSLDDLQKKLIFIDNTLFKGD